MKPSLKVGDLVWVYTGLSAPAEGTVAQILEQGVRVITENVIIASNRVYIEAYIFRRPEDREKLIARLEDDAGFFERCAKKLREEQQ